MDYFEYLELLWEYFPYIFYAFVFLTFLPKSLGKIKNFADADYAANRNKYHRCYGPDLCCHALVEPDDRDTPKQKPRRAVTRAYLRKQQQQQQSQLLSQRTASIADVDEVAPMHPSIKRQVQASAIQTQTNVNQIAKMFESSNRSMAHRKINRVLPEIRTSMYRSTDTEGDTDIMANTALDEQPYKKTNAQLAHLLQENIENSVNLLHQRGDDWHTETTLPTVVLQRRTRTVPNSLNYAGTSATPSTASPAISTPHSSPASNSPVQPSSPVLRTAPLNLKTSVEDIFAAIARSAEKHEEQFMYAGCTTLSPVTSIDDILSQRRLSRPLSAYSISDLLNDESTPNSGPGVGMGIGEQGTKDDNHFVENLLLSTLNKT